MMGTKRKVLKRLLTLAAVFIVLGAFGILGGVWLDGLGTAGVSFFIFGAGLLVTCTVVEALRL